MYSGMLRPQGYGIIIDPELPPVEHDTFTCSHCNKIVIVPPGWRPENMPSMCKGCSGYLCLACWNLRMRGADCVTWKQQIDRIEARNQALKSYGV